MNHIVVVAILQSIDHAYDDFVHNMLIPDVLMNVSVIDILACDILHHNVEVLWVIIDLIDFDNVLVGEPEEHIAFILEIVFCIVLSILNPEFPRSYFRIDLMATSVPVSWWMAFLTVAKFPSPMTSLKV